MKISGLWPKNFTQTCLLPGAGSMASDEGLVAQAAPSTPAVSVLEPAADAGAHGGAAEQSRFMLLSSCESIFQTFSGPAQYLQANLKEPCDVVDFRNWLRNTFPEAEDTLYSADEKLPKVPAASQDYACQQPLCIHVSALGFTGDCTLKPPPGGEFCKCLLEEILMDGFQSASDPLLVLQHEPDCAPLDLPCGDHGQLRAFSLAYVKGYTRAVTLLTALHRCKVLGLDGRTDEGLKPLWNSVTKVFVHCVEQPSRLDEALQNMKLSARGSLRRANNTIQCCFIIRNLKGKCGLVDSSVFVKRWNAMSSKAFQIVGKRSLALKQLLDQTPEETLNLILAHVNAYGWQNSCWSDDSLAVKKLYPGYQFACTKKSWLSRMKTTEESMDLCVRHLQSTFERKSEHLRQKADPQTVEDVSLRAAVCWHLGQELLSQVPIDPAKLEQVWYSNFAQGDGPVASELQGILMDKAENFEVRRDCALLKALCEQQNYSKPIAANAVEENALQIDKFAFVMKQLQYDVAVYETWVRKTSSVKTAQEQQRHLWMLQRRKRCEACAEAFLNRSLRLVVFDKRRAEQSIAEVMNFKREVCQQQGVNAKDMYNLVYWNCSAPCLMPQASYQAANTVLAWALNEQMKSAALIMTPTFSYSKGKVFLEEQALLQKLASGNHVLDWQFHLLFSNKPDVRDLRPMVYPGRFVFPSPLELPKNPWFACDLRRDQRTPEVKQLPAKDMREVESMSDDALPTSVDVRDSVHGAAKYWQIGSSACQTLLTSALTGVTPEPQAVLILDLFVRNGDFTEAFCKLKAGRSNVHYLGFCENQDEVLYVEAYLKETLAQCYESGQPTPTGEKIEQDMNEDMKEKPPPHPRLNLLAAWIKINISQSTAPPFLQQTIINPGMTSHFFDLLLEV